MTPEHPPKRGRVLVLSDRPHALRFLWRQRCTLHLTPDEIRAEERNGPFRTLNRHAWDGDTRFSVDAPGGPQASSKERDYGICMQSAGAESWLAVGYPRMELQEVLAALKKAQAEWRQEPRPADRTLRNVAAPPNQIQPPTERHVDSRRTRPGSPAPQVSAPVSRTPARRNSPAPAGSRNAIRIQRKGDGVHIEIPKAGLTHVSWLTLTLPTCGLTFMFWAGLSILSSGLAPESSGMALAAIALLFAGAMLALFNTLLGSAQILVDGSRFRVVRKSALRERRVEFSRGSVSHVRRGDSELQINESPLQELHIYVHGQRKIRMLRQRRIEDIDLIAETLRDVLGLRQDAGPE